MADVVRKGMAQVGAAPDFADRVRQHAAQFSWTQAAREYLGLYREVVEGNFSHRPGDVADRRAA